MPSSSGTGTTLKQPGTRAVAAAGPARPTGRPPLTERRKAATRLEIAHEAVRLFGERGVAATSGEDIARAAGISPRTLWRYFPSKEECVRPLLAAGLETVARRLRDWPADRSFCDGIQWDLPPAADPPEAASALRALIRLLPGEPGLRAVWLQVHHDAEPVFTEIIAARTGADPTDLLPRIKAVMLNGALRVAAEEWAQRSAEADGAAAAEALRQALLKATEGLAI
ncbi:TetR/AcrR family transcriptional regulator [Streptomyces milbemycinicus]|uniref:TetR/AcrR family transcriptional regulator n=1 Tax=Streptomyces milbemycinicus TaxID=476552 RepID=A0ABW8LIC6_9ACTN